MHRFASFTFANDNNLLTSLDNNTPPMFRAITRTTSKKLDFDNDDEDLSLSNSSPVLHKESLSGLFLNKNSRQGAISFQGNIPRSLAFEDDTDATINRSEQKSHSEILRKSQNETCGSLLLLPRFGSSGDIQVENKEQTKTNQRDAEVQELAPSRANKSLSQQSTPQKAFTENQDSQVENPLHHSHSLDSSLIKEFALKLSVSKNSRDPDLNTISPQTTAKLIHENSSSDYLIVDCRYDYEFQGGHIKDAINVLCPKILEQIFFTNKHLLYNPQYLHDLKKDLVSTLANLQSYEDTPQESLNKQLPLIIFHCEFSQKRGPRAFRTLRSRDRSMNLANFPHLDFPEIYVLEGGYCNFYPQFPELCEGGYLTMIDEAYSKEYAKSKQFEKSCWGKRSITDLSLLD